MSGHAAGAAPALPRADAALVLIERPDLARDDPGEALRIADPAAPHLLVNDLGVTRGDGIFEVVGAAGGRLHAMQAHLDRFSRSARLIDLAAPDQEVYRAAVRRAVDTLAERHPGAEIFCKFVMTRGLEYPPGDSEPHGWAVAMLGADHRAERGMGIDVVTLSRGVPRAVMQQSPWLLAGAKTLSYAANRAALREAARRGARDALFVSSDGWVLEGPSSSLVALIGGRAVTPPASDGVLPGTTQGDVFAWFTARAVPTDTRSLRVEELVDAEALWLTSSTRLAAPIRMLDGRPVPLSPITGELNTWLLGRDG